MSAKELLKVYIKEVFVRHGVLAKIILNKDIKFILAFEEAFIAEKEI